MKTNTILVHPSENQVMAGRTDTDEAAAWPPLRICSGPGVWWFRVFGVDLWVAAYREHPAPFSERNGGRVLPLGSWRAKVLTR